MPIAREILLNVNGTFPTESNIALNNPELHEVTLEPKMAAHKYLVENKNAEMLQNPKPKHLLSILNYPFNEYEVILLYTKLYNYFIIQFILIKSLLKI